ncbi:hypothetical protein AC578_7602 [Pseudocercospora eumusae]|uniref:Actin-like protein ARP6 n=1 Tax=Pseudocercospora eumusae TaxID=321146 RepID=A0A139HRR7_9PEZI|nr:hypothetical protein AC578_7602 [Pseudocercospora eumusae]
MAKSKATAPLHTAPTGLGKTTLIFDNGAHTIKSGLSTPGSEPATTSDCRLIPNCIARSQRDKLTYIGSDLDRCGDFGELALRRPVEKGFVVNWESEKAVWEKTMQDFGIKEEDVAGTNLVLTEQNHAPVALQRMADEMVFEEFGFGALWRGVGAGLNAYAPSAFVVNDERELGVPLECLVVVDAGHSQTSVTPLYHGRPIQAACRRLEVGGKTLTNYLKDLLSRQMDMHREEWISQEIKEDTCYVVRDSTEFQSRLERVWKGGQKDPREIDASIVVDYVLPDYEKLKRGFARPHDPSKGAKLRRLGIGGESEMVLPVGNERFTVPEILFTPSDIGMQQDGIAGTVMQSLEAIPKGLWQAFLANILVVGGTSKLPGFVERLQADLRSRIDDQYDLRVAAAKDPLKNAWLGGARLAQNEDLLKSMVVTRAEYMEHGDGWTRRKFAGKVGR